MAKRPHVRTDGKRPRTGSRVAAVQALFQSEQGGETGETIIDQFVRHRLGDIPDDGGFEDGRVPDAHVPLFTRIVRTAVLQQDTLDRLIAGALPPEWPMARLDPVMRAVLRAGGAELSMEDGPPLPRRHQRIPRRRPRLLHRRGTPHGERPARPPRPRPAPAGVRAGLTDLPGEFSLIARHFRPLAGPGGLDLLDDAALLDPPPGRTLVLTADAMVAGVHFLPDDHPTEIGRKLLRVNLSDLAAMGATPLAYLLTISAPRNTPDPWFAAFATGLAMDGKTFGIELLGGDTTHTPGPLTLSLTAIGHVSPGGAIRRTGAQPGDEIWVTGTIGDAALGLLVRQGQLPDPTSHLSARYGLPQPRLGLLRPGLVHAAMDVSDGLVQDLGHLARAAGLGAELWADAVPLSVAARATARRDLCLTGGDDYELLMAVAPEQQAALREAATTPHIPIARVGRFVPGAGVRLLDEAGTQLHVNRPGWSHF